MSAVDGRRNDLISRVRAAWSRTRPELDTSSIDVIGRIGRINSLATQQMEQVLQSSGVSRSEFEVLCALARSEHPLRASEVTSQTMLSGAATTKLSARLESAGLIRRARTQRDGRVVMLELTDEGRDVVDRELPRCLAHERELMARLDDAERETLVALLLKLSDASEEAQGR